MQKKPDLFDFIRGSPPINLVIGAVMIVTGILISDIPRMIASPGWPTTVGKITSNRVVGQKFEQYDGTF